jgi:hypothetical protein
MLKLVSNGVDERDLDALYEYGYDAGYDEGWGNAYA